MKRHYPNRPIVGVGAVVFSGDAVLLAQRGQEPGLGQWSLPGGGVELGESLIDAVIREIREEVSVTIKVGGLVGIFDRIFRDRENRVKYHYIIVDYWGWIVSGHPVAGSDASAIRLVPLESVNTFETTTEVKKTIWKAHEKKLEAERKQALIDDGVFY
jgi:ADP-ribose pyrophosphatase YjhB (NUDIX family)